MNDVFELSTRLDELRATFDVFINEGREFGELEARAYQCNIDALRWMARQMECEISRHRWNALPDDRERFVQEVLVEAISAPGSNVHAFPVIARPVPRIGGAA